MKKGRAYDPLNDEPIPIPSLKDILYVLAMLAFVLLLDAKDWVVDTTKKMFRNKRTR